MQKVMLFGQELPSPFVIASGTHSYEIDETIARRVVFIPKSVKYLETPGNPQPRTAPDITRADILDCYYPLDQLADKPGMVNYIGLQQLGVDAVVDKHIPKYQSLGARIILSVAGNAEPDYVYVIVKLGACEDAIIGYEINVSCPNVGAEGLVFGTDPKMTYSLISTLRKLTQKPLIVKLTPNIEDICAIARAAIEAGADGISLINTIKATARMRDGRTISGGLSGPMIFPIACWLLTQLRQSFPEIPIIAGGGVWSAEDAKTLFDLGATLVSVGTLNFTRPGAIFRLIDTYNSIYHPF